MSAKVGDSVPCLACPDSCGYRVREDYDDATKAVAFRHILCVACGGSGTVKIVNGRAARLAGVRAGSVRVNGV